MALSYGFALKSQDNSQEFSEISHTLFGDGISNYGGRFDASLSGDFAITLSPGFAVVNGRWMLLDEPYVISFAKYGRNQDRTYAIAIKADYTERKVLISLIENVNIETIKENPSIIRNDSEYNIILYTVFIKRGSSFISEKDIIDFREDAILCGNVSGYSKSTLNASYLYSYFHGGIDEDFARLFRVYDDSISSARAINMKIDSLAQDKGGYTVGDVQFSRNKPDPNDYWLICDGSEVPGTYPELIEVVGSNLPYIISPNSRFFPFIFTGSSVEIPPYRFYISENGDLMLSAPEGEMPDYRIEDGFLILSYDKIKPNLSIINGSLCISY